MRDDLVPGRPFPDLRLRDHTGEELSLSEIAAGQPLVVCFLRGWWCPKEPRVRMLVDLQDEIGREYGAIAALTIDEPYVNGAFRAGIGASFAFLSDEERRAREDADGREIQRGVLGGDVPEPGAEVSRSPVDGRPWLVHEVERADGRVAVHLRKGGEPDVGRLVRHHSSAPR